MTDAVRDANFSNEGTIQGGFRPLSNIMGLWLIQECRRDWQKAGQKLSWNDIVEEAKRAEPFRTIIDTDDSTFYAGGQMPEKIRAFARRTWMMAWPCGDRPAGPRERRADRPLHL